ncbi:MAG: hypothetical protein JNM56_16540, partial [Planctomycetia bacterium]|nr:hypothetical protein [Planctomycetia bacterium]
MTATNRLSRVGVGRFVAFGAGLFWLASLALADSTRPAPSQTDKQRQVQAETEKTARRMGTMIRLLVYNQLDKEAETKLLNEVATSLAGLSREQMTEVIARLEAAARAGDEDRTQQETDAAYARHREIISTLKSMLARYDAVKNLDQAAERLEQAAQAQLELFLRTSQAVQDKQNVTEKLFVSPRLRVQAQNQVRLQADDQKDLRQEVANMLKQAADLKEHLPADQRDRLNKLQAAMQKQNVLADMAKAA